MQITDMLFVYGTLKKGYHNHDAFLSTSLFMGSATTQDKWPLVVDGLPFLMDKKGFGYQVSGEVFKVNDDHTWAMLDRLEGHPRWYQRKPIIVKLGVKVIKAWAYLLQEVPTNLHLSHCRTSYELPQFHRN